MLAEDGREQVSGYHMLGDIVGLDGIGTDVHGCQAVALEDTEVCVLPFERIEEVARSVPTLQHNLHRLLSKEISRDQSVMLMLGSMRAEERLAVFLLSLAERYKRRGYSSTEFVLRMTREEIGSFLGLKLETVSRLFSRFQDEGLIASAGSRGQAPRSSRAQADRRPARLSIGRSTIVGTSSRFGQPSGRAVGSTGQRLTSHGERSRNTVSAEEAMPSPQKPKNPIV